jgi:hypothetical protein
MLNDFPTLFSLFSYPVKSVGEIPVFFLVRDLGFSGHHHEPWSGSIHLALVAILAKVDMLSLGCRSVADLVVAGHSVERSNSDDELVFFSSSSQTVRAF